MRDMHSVKRKNNLWRIRFRRTKTGELVNNGATSPAKLPIFGTNAPASTDNGPRDAAAMLRAAKTKVAMTEVAAKMAANARRRRAIAQTVRALRSTIALHTIRRTLRQQGLVTVL